MGLITGRFFVTAIADGQTIHGTLTANKSLVQRWTGQTAVPDWTAAGEARVVTLTVYKGKTITRPTSVKWFLNNQELSSGGGITIDNAKDQPTITIAKNLASSMNVDLDVLTFTGNVESNGNTIPFSASIDIKLAYVSGSGYTGIIEFLSNSDITKAQPYVILIPRLYKEADEVANSGFTPMWYFNNDTLITGSTTVPGVSIINNVTKDGKTYNNCLKVEEKAVTDYTVVRCDFKVGSKVETSDRVGIDDTVDEEYLWITYNGTEARSAALSPSQSVTFKMWVATMDDPTETKYRAMFTKYRITAYNSNGVVISGYNNKDITETDGSYKCGSVTFDYNTVYNNGGDISVIVSASNS